ncbi:MAG: hydantoinase B/oxoprolinase family protein, partial [Sinobacteraceae bacterium]|nr:hydantoinase B/oxoprolinase family protein [Nevskiaceae bacterium]
MSSGWQFWVDRGGTFTDVIGLSPHGQLHVRKVLSEADATDPAAAAVGEILASVATARAGSTGAGTIRQVKVGTTVGTNALLERKGSPVVLVTTRGFGDALRIGYQNRPDIFARHIVLPEQLYREVIEAQERIDADGNVISALDTQQLREALSQARGNGFRSVAIVFLHGWRFPQHEHAAARLARELGFEEVSVSHELAPLVRYVSRGDTTVLNGYLALPLRGYLQALQGALQALDAHADLQLMQSNGGLAPVEHFHALASVLSGPAGGLIGMQWIGQLLGMQQLVGFDMGGTSTDVSLIDDELPQRFEHQIGGIRLQTPMLDVHTIAAGGGSVLQFSEDRCAVGPDSAGARPGPACYGLGGPLTLTDVQVLLGRLRPETLPAVFGPQGNGRIDTAASTAGFKRLQQLFTASGRAPESLEALAASFLDVAVESMANAIHQVSTRQGLDARHFTLFCFGGAAGQHACRVAQAVGMTRILIHPLASVLSAFGIGVADRLATRRASLRLPLTAAGLENAHARLAVLEREAWAAVATEPGDAGPDRRPTESPSCSRWLELRGGDSETTLSVSATSLAMARKEFAAAHLRRFGFAGASDLIIEAVRVEARAASIDATSLQMPTAVAPASLPPSVHAWFGSWREVPMLPPAAVHAGLKGPALIVEPNSTVVVEPGWSVQRLPGGELVLEHAVPPEAPMPADAAVTLPEASTMPADAVPAPANATATPADPARLEIFNNLFMHIAEQMGEVLKATAQSVNIKERLDYSCALFAADGGLVANAPHMPVHLGSMGACVRAVIEDTAGRMSAGDSWLLNSPYHGGTHLPDMTVVTPVFMTGTARPDFFVASRAHHADIGGSSPGSMPAFSRSIDEEGVLFACFPLVSAG